MAVIAGLLAAAVAANLAAPDDAIGIGLTRVAFAAAAVTWCAGAAARRGESLRTLGTGRNEPAALAWLALALGVAGWLTLNGLNSSLPPWWPPDLAGSDPALALVMIVLVAPAGEEVFFRGFVRQALRPALPPWTAILVLTTLGVVHSAIAFPGATPDLLVGQGLLAFTLAAAAEVLKLPVVVGARLLCEAGIVAGGMLLA